MRPYIVINGKDSRSIEGLLICSTPSIRKPLKRSNIEEIDGVDGDIITILGYSAYDKSFDIGLTKDYDIDEVIEYFNTSGTVIFSNEPDKYYNFNLLEAIDFEKLIRFKTATVTMHVQPFKYSAIESERDFTFKDTEGSFKIKNAGNIESKPLITLEGSGAINLYLNGVEVLAVQLDTSSSSIAIDVNSMNAYNPTSGAFLNRYVIGDYNDLMLKVGQNTIAFTGNVTNISIKHYSRWI